MSLPDEIAEFYARGAEQARLIDDPDGQLEFLRTQVLLDRLLPPPPAAIADVGGGAGIHAAPMAERGYEVHLIDPVPLHVEQAAGLGLASALVGDARELPFEDERFDAVLLLGPLYHLPERADRVAALAEARRVVRPGGRVVAAAISRYASTIDGLSRHLLDEEGFEASVERDLVDGRHVNPERRPHWFTTAYFHLPEDLPGELEDAGLASEGVFAIEGPAWFMAALRDHLGDPQRRERLLRALERVESAPSLLGASAHLLAVGRR
jgi:ubiquinone/menaquinone biosynthesis C-methylase UbiE